MEVGTDETWLPVVGSVVGSKGGVLLTADKRIHYNFLEKRALEQYAVREFVFASGNMSGEDMGAALELAAPKMWRLARKRNRRSSPPSLASAKSISAGPKANNNLREQFINGKCSHPTASNLVLVSTAGK